MKPRRRWLLIQHGIYGNSTRSLENSLISVAPGSETEKHEMGHDAHIDRYARHFSVHGNGARQEES